MNPSLWGPRSAVSGESVVGEMHLFQTSAPGRESPSAGWLQKASVAIYSESTL